MTLIFNYDISTVTLSLIFLLKYWEPDLKLYLFIYLFIYLFFDTVLVLGVHLGYVYEDLTDHCPSMSWWEFWKSVQNFQKF